MGGDHICRKLVKTDRITSPLLTRAHRQDFLHGRWGFGCSCEACSASAAEINASDLRLERISSILPLLLDDQNGAIPNTADEAAAVTELADSLVSLATEERLDAVMLDPYRAAALEWNAVGDREKAVEYANLAVEYGTTSLGPRDHKVKDMQSLVGDPERHWSWKLRIIGPDARP